MKRLLKRLAEKAVSFFRFFISIGGQMANYLKGIGDAATRVNEILPSLDARINNFLCGHTAGIIKGEFNDFSASAIDRGVIVRSGMFQAHGYFGCSDTDTQFNFVMPSTTQYVHLYAEIDLSVVPNRFEVKATAMSNTSAWTPRQDNLRSITNGKYQFALWQVTLTASTIILSDKRMTVQKPLNAVNAEVAVRLSGSIDSAVTATTQPQTDNSTKVATTAHVRQAANDINQTTNGKINALTADLQTKIYYIYDGSSRSQITTSMKSFLVWEKEEWCDFYFMYNQDEELNFAVRVSGSNGVAWFPLAGSGVYLQIAISGSDVTLRLFGTPLARLDLNKIVSGNYPNKVWGEVG